MRCSIFAVLSSMMDNLYKQFYFKLDYEHDFYYNITVTKSYGEMLNEFQEQARYRFWYFTQYVSVAQMAVGILVIFVVAE